MKCTGLKAVSYPDTQHLIKGSTVQIRTDIRIYIYIYIVLCAVIRFNMEFRILEIKNAHMRPKYKPQYKNSGWFSSWKNISQLRFTDTIFCSVKFSDWDSNCLWVKSDADKVIKELKEYLQSSEEYTVVHNCN